MTCIKTGCQIFIEPYQEYAYGDGFRVADAYVFRLCARSLRPINRTVKHFTVRNFDHWFDEFQTGQLTNSTMIAVADDVTDHGYDGTTSTANEP